jgi:hypothetical protein
MMNKYFDFKQERGFDRIIEGGFSFFKENGKNLIRIFWKYNKVLFIAMGISYFLYFYYYFDFMNIVDSIENSGNVNESDNSIYIFGLIAVVMILVTLFFFPRFLVTIFGFVKVYMENHGNVTDEEVKKHIDREFWRMFGLLFMLGFIGFILIVLLGSLVVGLAQVHWSLVVIFVFVLVFALIYMTMHFSILVQTSFFEKKPLVEAISKTTQYINNKLGLTFGVFVVLYLIMSFIRTIFNIPMYIYMFLKMAWLSDTSEMFSYFKEFDIVLSLVSVISFVGDWIVNLLFLVTTSVLYFSLREFYTQEGVMEKIDQIGKNDEEPVV